MALLRRERLVVLLALAAVTAIAWLYLFAVRDDMAMQTMDDMPGMVVPFVAPWVFVMWWVMMLGMMLPSAAQMVLTFTTLQRRKRDRGEPYVPTLIFVAGYLIVWGMFSAVATVVQWGLQRLSLLSPMGAPLSAALGGVLFLLAGLYQFTPWKNACLRQCRSPFAFVLNHWRDGYRGALSMGITHGLYCLGCCWVLMALLFAIGVMNLLWFAVLAVFVFAEKLLPHGVWSGRVAGMAMAGFGLWLLMA